MGRTIGNSKYVQSAVSIGNCFPLHLQAISRCVLDYSYIPCILDTCSI